MAAPRPMPKTPPQQAQAQAQAQGDTVIIPLIEVAKRGNEDQIAELLAQGADVNVLDAVGNNALHWAANGGHLTACQLLVKHKINIQAINKNGDTALHKAAWRNHAEVCQFLLDSGINRDVRNKDGKTALDLSRCQSVRKVLVPPVECKPTYILLFFNFLFFYFQCCGSYL
jgi:ankyrin repeat protein